MAYIEGLTISGYNGHADVTMEFEDGDIKTYDANGRETGTYRLSTYQLRRLADWCDLTANELADE